MKAQCIVMLVSALDKSGHRGGLNISLLLLALMALVLPLEHGMGGEPRTWTTDKGYVLENARLLVRGPQRIVLLLDDSSTFGTVRNRLSEADRRYLDALTVPQADDVPALDGWMMRWSPRTFTADYACTVRCRRGRASNWVAYVAQPPSLAWQQVEHFAARPSARPATERGPLQRPLLRIESNTTALQLKTTLRTKIYHTMFVPPRPGDIIEPLPPLDKETRQQYLLNLPQIDFEATPFQEWLARHELQRLPQESEWRFAQRLMRQIVGSYKYRYARDLRRRASDVAEQTANDCGGLSNLVVAAFRANDIPARVLVGRVAKSSLLSPDSKQPVATIDGPHRAHIVCEFYAAGIGWIPIDAAAAVQRGLSNRGEAVFGRLNSFIALHVDTDFELDSKHLGWESVPYLQIPPFWAHVSVRNAEMSFEENWTVKQLDLRTETR